MARATAQMVAYVDRTSAFMPTGTTPPFVLRLDAGSVLVGDLVFASKAKTVAELQDAALFKLRPLFAPLPGLSAPPAVGSSQRIILVRLNPNKLRSYSMSPDEVGRWLLAVRSPHRATSASAANQLVVGAFKDLSNVPVRSQGTQTIFIRDLRNG